MQKGSLRFSLRWESIAQTICNETESSNRQRAWLWLTSSMDSQRNKLEEHSFQSAGQGKLQSASIFCTLNHISVEILAWQSSHVHWDHFTPCHWKIENNSNMSKWQTFHTSPPNGYKKHVKQSAINCFTRWIKMFLGISFARAVENAKIKKIILTYSHPSSTNSKLPFLNNQATIATAVPRIDSSPTSQISVCEDSWLRPISLDWVHP